MTIETFSASTQYNDWKGSSAADDADKIGASRWLKENGHMSETEFLVGVTIFAGESHGEHVDPVYVEFLIMAQGDYENARLEIERSSEHVEVRRVRIDLKLKEFFGLFKRFAITLSRGGMLEGLSYRFSE